MIRRKPYKFLLIASILTMILFLQNCSSTETKSPEVQTQIKAVHKNYIGDEQCFSCHQDQHNSWSNSHHDWAMKEPNDSTVLGDFNDKIVQLDGVKYTFSRSKILFKVTIEEAGSKNSYYVWKTFGFWPLQQYLVKGDNGEIYTLRVSWNSESSQWYHQYSQQKIAPDDWLHWTKGGQRWNTMCADCHSTNVKKNYDPEKQHFATSYSSLTVGCESCHGPGSEHLAWAKNPSDGDKGIFKAVDQKSILNTCAPCHSRRTKLREEVLPWEDYHENYWVQNLSPDFYEVDGQIKEEDYVFGSFLSSKMYHEGVKCDDCHDPHSLKLKAEGNNLCLSCHEPEYNKKEHHFHEENTLASNCVNCHMPGKNYMGHDFRRDHSFRVPRPDQSVRFGTSNACNQCHHDKSPQWAAKSIEKWYGAERKVHFSDFLALSSREELDSLEQKKLVAFVYDPGFPEIARSAVVENLQYKLSAIYLKELVQNQQASSPMVLNSVLQILTQESPEARLYFARQHLNHSNRMVRMSATKLVLGIPQNQFSNEELQWIQRNEKELLQSLKYNSDFPSGRLQLADYYLQKNQIDKALQEYAIALKMDSLLLPVYSNLATAFNLKGQNEKALQILDIGIRKDPMNGQLDYLKGLLLHEMGLKNEAIRSLNHSINKSPRLVKSYYNLGVILIEDKKWSEAIQIVDLGLQSNPNASNLEELKAYIQGQKQN
ncbi:MAG: multiheme c-type cytochrome [Crocinitomicaceae bacterium]